MGIKVVNHQATCANLKKMLEDRGYTPRDLIQLLNLQSVQAVYKWYATAQGRGERICRHLII